jgi:hypothetical protein
MTNPEVRRYRSRATDRAVAVLLERMTAAERRALGAALIDRKMTVHEYVGALLTRSERWDLVEWEALPSSEC